MTLSRRYSVSILFAKAYLSQYLGLTWYLSLRETDTLSGEKTLIKIILPSSEEEVFFKRKNLLLKLRGANSYHLETTFSGDIFAEKQTRSYQTPPLEKKEGKSAKMYLIHLSLVLGVFIYYYVTQREKNEITNNPSTDSTDGLLVSECRLAKRSRTGILDCFI